MTTPPHLPFETITIGTVFSGVSGVGVLGLFTLLLRQIGPWRKQTNDATDNLIKLLTNRINKVEKQLAVERRMNYIELRKMEARYAAQRALDRHKFNNADGNLDSLLRILELSPEKAPEAARQAREAREVQRRDESLEATEIHKAEMAAIVTAEKELDALAVQEAEDLEKDDG